ncbi:MAG: cyanophycin synthetase [Marinilabiliales bacterium]
MKNNNLNKYPIIKGPLTLEEIHVLSGANYFSGDRVVRLRINLNEYDEVFTNEITGFYDKLKKTLPTIKKHHCSVGRPGGFLLRVKEGTLLGHVIEHIAIELQILANMDVGFGKTRMTKKQGVYNVVFRFIDEIAGIYAGVHALNLVNSILLNKDFNIKQIIDELIKIKQDRFLGISTNEIVKVAENKKIPWQRLDDYNLVQLGTGKYRKLIRATVTEKTSLIAVETTDNKHQTIQILNEYGIPVPNTAIVSNAQEAIDFYKLNKNPVVIKPSIGSGGLGIILNLDNEETITKGFNHACKYDDIIIAQNHIQGKSYRILIIDNKYVAAVELTAPYIIGNGNNSILELINEENKNRNQNKDNKPHEIPVTEDLIEYLNLLNLGLESVLEKNRKLVLYNSGNVRKGGQSKDVTENVHQYNRTLCEHISKIMNLDVVGIDIISEDISKPLNENNAKIIELNSAPDFLPHIYPNDGQKRNVAENFVSMLFPDDNPVKIPLFAVTGSYGCSLLLDIIAFWFIEKGKNPGIVNTSGIYTKRNFLLKQLNEITSDDIKTLLKDPTLDYALCEVPIKSILHDGLAYKYADIGIILNIDKENPEYYTYDHIRDADDLAYAASVVAEEVEDDGFTILNGDDADIVSMAERCYSKVVFFCENIKQNHIKKHINNNGIVCFIDRGDISIINNNDKINITSISNLKNFDINKPGHINSLLAVVSAMYVWGESADRINNILLKYFKE